MLTHFIVLTQFLSNFDDVVKGDEGERRGGAGVWPQIFNEAEVFDASNMDIELLLDAYIYRNSKFLVAPLETIYCCFESEI